MDKPKAREERSEGGRGIAIFTGIPSGQSLRRRERRGGVCVCVRGGGGVGGRATVSIDLVSYYHFISRCLLDVITQFDVAEIAREHQRKG